jgi:FtsP/CotA-like multicopper oxidase with cupredoxin domain
MTTQERSTAAITTDQRAAASPSHAPHDSARVLGVGGLLSLGLSGCLDLASESTSDGAVDPHANCTDHRAVAAGDGRAPNARCMGGGSGSPGPSPTPAPAVPGRAFASLGTNVVSVAVAAGTHSVGGANHAVWYFAGNGTAGNGFNGDRVLPSPVIEAVQGQTVQLTLRSMLPHTIHPHGLDVNQANDGVPETSGFVGMQPMMGNFGRLPPGAASLGGSFTYSFTAPFAGTYLYHCHVDTVLHMEMGLYGVLIVRPPDGGMTRAWAGGPAFDKEYLWVLHTMDTTWHVTGMMNTAVSGPGTARYRPNVFMINGRDGAALRTDPTVAISGAPGQTVLLRLANPGYLPALVELGGIEFQVIASDGRPLANAFGTTSYLVAPGERYDVLFTLPAGGVRSAIVQYQNIRGIGAWGTAATTITSA